ncbi:MAG: hypothetical protein ABIP48_03670, partial [Planctomycetota bacterium]
MRIPQIWREEKMWSTGQVPLASRQCLGFDTGETPVAPTARLLRSRVRLASLDTPYWAVSGAHRARLRHITGDEVDGVADGLDGQG